MNFSSLHTNFSSAPLHKKLTAEKKILDIFGSGQMYFLVPFQHLKEIPVIWGFGILRGLSWTVQGLWGSGSASWRKLCDLDLFPCHLWIRDGALSTHEGAVSGPFLMVSQALSDLCLRGLGDGSCCFPMEPERLRVRKKARMEGGASSSGVG